MYYIESCLFNLLSFDRQGKPLKKIMSKKIFLLFYQNTASLKKKKGFIYELNDELNYFDSCRV